MNRKIKVLLLGRNKESTRIVFNFLQSDFDVEKVMVEEAESRKKIIKRRIKRLGWLTVIGQLLFQVFIVRILKLFAKTRLNRIYKEYNLNTEVIPQENIIKVSSINSKKAKEYFSQAKPDIIVVNGTRIISKEVLAIIKVPIINTHVGITPMYRGVHGGYWALANEDIENCGVTVHLIDTGIDTGGVLAQTIIIPTSKDNFVTYPLIQLGSALPLLRGVIRNFNNLKTIETRKGDSKLLYHPTIWEYLYYRMFKGVK